MTHPLSIISDADQAVRMYEHIRSGGGQLRDSGFFGSRDKCMRLLPHLLPPKKRDGKRLTKDEREAATCGGARSAIGVKGREKPICASCGLAWSGVSEGWIRTRVQGSGDPYAHERLMDLWCRLRPMIENRPRVLTDPEWLFDRQALAISIEGHGRSISETTRVGQEKCSALACPPARRWTPDIVRSAVERARNVIERRLRDAKSRRGAA